MVNDHSGTPALWVNSKSVVVWQDNTTPFGEHVVGAFVGTVNQSLHFPGQYADFETGYSYNYFRDYDPSLGRYLQSDPIGLLGGVNTYSYVSASPVQLQDLYGLDASLCPVPERKPLAEQILDDNFERALDADGNPRSKTARNKRHLSLFGTDYQSYF